MSVSFHILGTEALEDPRAADPPGTTCSKDVLRRPVVN